MEKYVKPVGIQNDMGGGNDEPDHRMAEIFRLLEYAPFIQGRILDIGVGRGQISRYFLENPSVTHVEGIRPESKNTSYYSEFFSDHLLKLFHQKYKNNTYTKA